MDLESNAKKIVDQIFGLKAGESFLILTEKFDDKLSLSDSDKKRWKSLNAFVPELFYEIKKYFGKVDLFEYPSTGRSGKEPPIETWEKAFGKDITDLLKDNALMDKLLNKSMVQKGHEKITELLKSYKSVNYNVIMAMTNFSTTHTSFRKLLTERFNVRYASMPRFDPDMFNTSMSADFSQVEDVSIKLAKKLNQYQKFRIISDNGTDLMIYKEGRHVEPDTGNLRKPGTYGNLPAGEAYFAPIEGKSYGKLIMEYSITGKMDSPITVNIKEGRAESTEGSATYLREFLEKLDAHPNNRNVAEAGFGTNDKAVKFDNILETEKIFGTVHIAFGDNMGFGGNVSAPFHEDYIILNPEVYGINNGVEELIIKNRKLLLD